MDKGELYDNFEKMEAQTLEMSQLLASMRDEMTQVLERNTQLEVENTHLRERLNELEHHNKKSKSGHGLSNLKKLYHDGFHICTEFFGSRIEGDGCMFCQAIIINGEKNDNTTN